MATALDICNLALGRLGDEANVSSIDPPEGSVQAQLCANYYPMARDSLLESHSWGFATKRATLAQLGTGWPEWDYSYALPSDFLRALTVLPNDATDDVLVAGVMQPQPYAIEVDDQGRRVLYSDQADAVLRYTAKITDTSKFPPMFVDVLTLDLAGKLAGPLIKGDAGRNTARALAQEARSLLAAAVLSDSNQRRNGMKYVSAIEQARY